VAYFEGKDAPTEMVNVEALASTLSTSMPPSVKRIWSASREEEMEMQYSEDGSCGTKASTTKVDSLPVVPSTWNQRLNNGANKKENRKTDLDLLTSMLTNPLFYVRPILIKQKQARFAQVLDALIRFSNKLGVEDPSGKFRLGRDST